MLSWGNKHCVFQVTGMHVSPPAFRLVDKCPQNFLEKIFHFGFTSEQVDDIFNPQTSDISNAVEIKYKEILNPPKKRKRKLGLGEI
jgi:hypothetical protein